jgi:hypothetical protein
VCAVASEKKISVIKYRYHQKIIVHCTKGGP